MKQHKPYVPKDSAGKLAKAFIKSKAKNQLNYLKYLEKYHDNLDNFIETIEKKT